MPGPLPPKDPPLPDCGRQRHLWQLTYLERDGRRELRMVCNRCSKVRRQR